MSDLLESFTRFRAALANRLCSDVLADLADEIRVDVTTSGDAVRIITWGEPHDSDIGRVARKVCAPDRAVLAFVERDSWVVYVYPRLDGVRPEQTEDLPGPDNAVLVIYTAGEFAGDPATLNRDEPGIGVEFATMPTSTTDVGEVTRWAASLGYVVDGKWYDTADYTFCSATKGDGR